MAKTVAKAKQAMKSDRYMFGYVCVCSWSCCWCCHLKLVICWCFLLNFICLKLESLRAAGRRKRGNRFPQLRNWKWWSGVPASVKFQLCNFKNILSFCEEIADSSLEAANGCGPREGENGYIFGESSTLPGQDQAQWEIHVRKAGTWHVYVFNIQLFISTWCRNEAWSDSSTTSKVKFLP